MKDFVLSLFLAFLAVVIILSGWFLINCFFGKRDYDYNYEHFLMQENGYNYCPYCGVKLQEIDDEESEGKE